MSEKYFEYLLGFFFVAALFFTVVWFLLRWRMKYLQNLTHINILKRQQKLNREVFFSTYIINRCVRIMYFTHDQAAHKALTRLVVGYPEQAVAYISRTDKFAAALLMAHFSAADCLKQIKKSLKTWYQNPKYAVFVPIVAHLVHDRRTMTSALKNIQFRTFRLADRIFTAYHAYILSFNYLYAGDMLSASQTASSALKIFQKKQYAIETAACHLALAEIYRISCVNDIAETMINSAVKIYQTQKTPLFSARATVIKGMLMVFENRHDAAEALYQQALNMPITEQLRADIYNQQALLLIAENRLSEALKTAETALKIQNKLKNIHGQAFSLQLIGQIAYLQNRFRKAVDYINRAAAIYNRTQNPSAYAECLYTAASAQYKLNFLAQSEKNLRTLLEYTHRCECNFHRANAYSLLGLIYLQKGELQRAKVLFQQSLHLEQSHQRCEALAADYSNLALIESLTLHPEDAAATWQLAREYAEQSEDKDLIELIKSNCTK